MKDLKKCPFCGREGKMTSSGIKDFPAYVAHCPGGSFKKSEGGCMMRPHTAPRSTKEEAIEDWNQRALEP